MTNKLNKNQTKGLAQDLESIYSRITNTKAPVLLISDLPTSGNDDGDIRLCMEDHNLYIWSASTSTWECKTDVQSGGGSSLPTGGTTGQILSKSSDVDGEATWVNNDSKSVSFDNTETTIVATDVETAIKEVFQISNEVVTTYNNAQLSYAETITQQGGTVDSTGEVPTVAEINSGIESIASGGSGGTSDVAKKVVLDEYNWKSDIDLFYTYSSDNFDASLLFASKTASVPTTITSDIEIIVKIVFTEAISTFNLKYYVGDQPFGTQPTKMYVTLEDGTILADAGYNRTFPKSTTGTIAVTPTSANNTYYVKIKYTTNLAYPFHVPSIYIDRGEVWETNYAQFNKVLKSKLPTTITDPTTTQIYFTKDGGIYISSEDGTIIKCGVDAEDLAKLNAAATETYVDQKISEFGQTAVDYATDEEIQSMLTRLGLGGE